MKKFFKGTLKVLSFVLIIVCSFFAFSGCLPGAGFESEEDAAAHVEGFKGIKAIYIPKANRAKVNVETEANLQVLTSLASEILYKLAVHYGLGYANIENVKDYYNIEEKLLSETWILEDGIVKTKVTDNAIVSFPTDIKTDVDYNVNVMNDAGTWKLIIENEEPDGENIEIDLTHHFGSQYFIDENDNDEFDEGEELYHINTVGLTAFRDFNGNGVLDNIEHQLGTLNAINNDNWGWALTEQASAEEFIVNYLNQYTNLLVAEMINITLNINTVTEANLFEKAKEFTYYGLTDENITALRLFIKNTVVGSSKINTDNGNKNSVMASNDVVKIISSDAVKSFYVFDVNQNGSTEVFDENTVQLVENEFKNYTYMIDTIIDEAVVNNLEQAFGAGKTYFYNIYIQNYDEVFLQQKMAGSNEWILPDEHYLGLVYCLNVEKLGAQRIGIAYIAIGLETNYVNNFVELGFHFNVIFSGQGNGYNSDIALTDIVGLVEDPDNYGIYSDFDPLAPNIFNLAESWDNDLTAGGSPTLLNPNGSPISVYDTITNSFHAGIISSLEYGDLGWQYVDANNDVLSLMFASSVDLPISFTFTLQDIWGVYLDEI